MSSQMVKPVRAAILLLATVLLYSFALHTFAGEPIVFGSAKTKVEPDKEKLPIQSPFKLDSLRTSTPLDFNSLIPVLPRLDSNGRKDKHQQNAEDERKNWMFLEPGELDRDDAENNFLGIRDDEDKDDLGRSKGSREYMFKDTRNGLSSRIPGQAHATGAGRKPGANKPPPPQ